MKLRHLGDVLLTVPVFRALKHTFPGCRLTALVNAGTEGVLQKNPLIDEVLTLDRSVKRLGAIERYRREASFIRDVRRLGFDMTVDLTGGDRAALLSYLSGAPSRIGWKSKRGFLGKQRLYTGLTRPDHNSHMVLQNLAVVRAAGVDGPDLRVDFPVEPKDRDFVREVLHETGNTKRQALVHVHPTSRWLFKCWKDESMGEVIAWLLREGAAVAVTASAAESELRRSSAILAHIKAHAHDVPGLIDLSGRTTIGQLAALSEQADLFLGVDSAPMHVAAAVNTPVIALFGPTGACHWGPWNNGAAAPDGDHDFSRAYTCEGGTQCWGMHTVIQRAWDCIPCGQDGCRSTKVSNCLMDISPGEVEEILSVYLKEVGA